MFSATELCRALVGFALDFLSSYVLLEFWQAIFKQHLVYRFHIRQRVLPSSCRVDRFISIVLVSSEIFICHFYICYIKPWNNLLFFLTTLLQCFFYTHCLTQCYYWTFNHFSTSCLHLFMVHISYCYQWQMFKFKTEDCFTKSHLILIVILKSTLCDRYENLHATRKVVCQVIYKYTLLVYY